LLQNNAIFSTKYISHVHCPTIVCYSQHMTKDDQFSAPMRRKTFRGVPP